MSDDISVEEFLAHHGVKGMHWGVRRYEKRINRLNRVGSGTASKTDHIRVGARELSALNVSQSGSYKKAAQDKADYMQKRVDNIKKGDHVLKNRIQLYGADLAPGVYRDAPGSSSSPQVSKKAAKSDKEWGKDIGSVNSAIAVNNAGSKTLNGSGPKGIDAFNAKWEKSGKPYGKAYYDTYSKHAEKIFQAEADKIYGSNPSNSKKVKVTYHVTGTGLPHLAVVSKDIKHADEVMRFRLKLDKKGKIVGIEPMNDSVAHIAEVSDFMTSVGLRFTY